MKSRVKIKLYRPFAPADGQGASPILWRWLVDELHSGQRVASVTEAYRRRIDAIRNLELVTGFRVPVIAHRARRNEFCWGATLHQRAITDICEVDPFA